VKALSERFAVGESLMADIERAFTERIRSSVPALRGGVRAGLEILAETGVPVDVVTEGADALCASILRIHNLDHLISGIRSSKKSKEFFRGLISTSRLQYFVGDQLDVDIALAHEAGFKTIYFPGAFMPEWTLGVADLSDFRVTSFREVPDIVLGIRPGRLACCS